MPSEHTSTTSSTAPHDGASTSSRALRFARRHPALTVLGAGGAALLGGIELAAGVLIGAGVSMLVRKRGAAATGETSEVSEQPSPASPGFESFGAERGYAGEAIAHEERDRTPPTSEATGAEPHEEHDRTRELLQRAPEAWRRRARAVFQAARGKLEPRA